MGNGRIDPAVQVRAHFTMFGIGLREDVAGGGQVSAGVDSGGDGLLKVADVFEVRGVEHAEHFLREEHVQRVAREELGVLRHGADDVLHLVEVQVLDLSPLQLRGRVVLDELREAGERGRTSPSARPRPARCA